MNNEYVKPAAATSGAAPEPTRPAPQAGNPPGIDTPTLLDRLQGGLWGLLIGDAAGVPYEFKPPAALPAQDRIDMVPPAGFARTYAQVPPGIWSDDGAQALVLLDHLLAHDGLEVEAFGRALQRWLDAARAALRQPSYRQAIQAAAALGHDTDTTACVAGGLAGIRHGVQGLWSAWLASLRGKDVVEPLLARLAPRS